MAVRQAHIRDTFGIAFTGILQTVADTFSNEQKLKAHLGFDEVAPTAESEAAITEILSPFRAQIEAAGYNFEIIKWLGFKDIQAKFPEIYRQMIPDIRENFEVLRQSTPALIRSAHNKALAQSLHSTKRENELAQLGWRIQETSCELILPDCVAVAGDKTGRLLPALLANETPLMVVPISAKQLLLGTDVETSFQGEGDINHALIGCSLDFFIAKTHSPTYLSALPDVGQTVENFLAENQPNL